MTFLLNNSGPKDQYLKDPIKFRGSFRLIPELELTAAEPFLSKMSGFRSGAGLPSQAVRAGTFRYRGPVALRGTSRSVPLSESRLNPVASSGWAGQGKRRVRENRFSGEKQGATPFSFIL